MALDRGCRGPPRREVGHHGPTTPAKGPTGHRGGSRARPGIRVGTPGSRLRGTAWPEPGRGCRPRGGGQPARSQRRRRCVMASARCPPAVCLVCQRVPCRRCGGAGASRRPTEDGGRSAESDGYPAPRGRTVHPNSDSCYNSGCVHAGVPSLVITKAVQTILCLKHQSETTAGFGFWHELSLNTKRTSQGHHSSKPGVCL